MKFTDEQYAAMKTAAVKHIETASQRDAATVAIGKALEADPEFLEGQEAVFAPVAEGPAIMFRKVNGVVEPYEVPSVKS